MSRVGVFVCHCGENIARAVDPGRVAAAMREVPGVVMADHYTYMCSAPGQQKFTDAIEQYQLTGAVVAACSPQLHEPTFRAAASRAGLNPYRFELANIREQCSWVHPGRDEATAKAIRIALSAVQKVSYARPLFPSEVPITKRAMVIGGGVAGIRAALDIANSGFEVVLVERQTSIGGNMARLSETFPTLDCSQCILTPLMVEAFRHPRIELLTASEVEEVSGYVGNFKARIVRRPTFVKPELCTACGDCAAVCPVSVPNEFDQGLGWRKAIYLPFPQAVPSVYALDARHCVNSAQANAAGYRVLACERCAKACKRHAIDFDMPAAAVERQVGAVVVATGYEMMAMDSLNPYGYGRLPDVVDSLEFERLLAASGPTGGQLLRPSDGRPAKDIVFVQCVGSRDPKHGLAYCSRVCCMYTAKHAMLFKHKVPDGRATVFYIDIRAAGKGYEEFVQRVMEEERVLYLRGRVSRVQPAGEGRLIVYGSDTLAGQPVQVSADLVVLASAMVPASGSLANLLRVPTDSYGFYQEAHPKLRPVETLTAGIFITGAAHGPKDIPDTVAQASAAAAKSLTLLTQTALQREPTVAVVDEAVCMACFECEKICPYGAIGRKTVRGSGGGADKTVATVNPAMCEGCGACAGGCRAGALDLLGFSDTQLFEQISALTSEALP
jgi:heterodisulfide reductase subunit A2